MAQIRPDSSRSHMRMSWLLAWGQPGLGVMCLFVAIVYGIAGAAVSGLPEAVADSAFQIAGGLFLAALTQEEHDGVTMRVNHSCEPNVGRGGNVLLEVRGTDWCDPVHTDGPSLTFGQPGRGPGFPS